MSTAKLTYTESDRLKNQLESILAMEPPANMRKSVAKPNNAAMTNCYIDCRRDENYVPTETTLLSNDDGVGFDFDYYVLIPIEQLQTLLAFAQSGQIVKE